MAPHTAGPVEANVPECANRASNGREAADLWSDSTRKRMAILRQPQALPGVALEFDVVAELPPVVGLEPERLGLADVVSWVSLG